MRRKKKKRNEKKKKKKKKKISKKKPQKEIKGHNIPYYGQINKHHSGWQHKKTVCEVKG